jgi:hypothetical protein
MERRIGERRRMVRTLVASFVLHAKTVHLSSVAFRRELRAAMSDAPRGSRLRRLWFEELRRAGVSIRRPHDYRQLSLFGEAAE